MEDYKENFNLEELIGDMMGEIITLRSENTIMKQMVRLLYLREAPELNAEQFEKFYHQVFEEMSRELIANHKWFEGYWKEKLKGLFQ